VEEGVGVHIRTVGIDYRKDALETHRALLEAGIWVVEGLDLSEVEPGEYELVCTSQGRATVRDSEGDLGEGSFSWPHNTTTPS
jgi:hypothetical protein